MEKEIRELEEEAVLVDGIKMVSLAVAKQAIESVYSAKFTEVTDQLQAALSEYSQAIKDVSKL
jgi:hypothetical protein